MDVKGAQALRARIAAAPDDDSRPDHRLLLHSVGFSLQRQHDTGRYDIAAAGEVDRFGCITLRRMKPHMPATLADYEARQAERLDEMAEHLLDEGLAEWRATGDGDTELYATQEFLRRLAPALASLPSGWQQWP